MKKITLRNLLKRFSIKQIIDVRNTDQEILILKRFENCLIERQNSKYSVFLFPLSKKKKILHTISAFFLLKKSNQNTTATENFPPISPSLFFLFTLLHA